MFNRRQEPDSDKYDMDVLNAMYDSIGEHQENARKVQDGQEDELGLKHYGEIMVSFSREDGTVQPWIFANYLIRENSPGFFNIDEDGVLADTRTNESIRELVNKIVEPLDMDDVEIVKDDELIPDGSGWSGFAVRRSEVEENDD
jgi:hypothetical protein